jgi:flavin-dependent dehydrogenase
MSIKKYHADVIIIGAGPAGALAATLLCGKGYSVAVFEREIFPRFSIGESLLPQAMLFLEKAGVLGKIEQAGFQPKDGAAFQRGQQHNIIDFSNAFTAGWNTTFQVQRAAFDHLLADHAAQCGANIYFSHTVTAYEETNSHVCLRGKDNQGQDYEVTGRFVLDGSGYGRVLPRLLGLDKPSNFPARKALFTHVKDNISHPSFDRQKILITVHHQNPHIWYWLIPFADGTSSIGVVGHIDEIEAFGNDDSMRLKKIIQDDVHLTTIMPNPQYIRAIGALSGYACGVKQLHGKKFALLGNAGEFLDPIFSSGVTIALKSADLATELLCRQLQGEIVDWDKEYTEALMVGVNAFRVFVEGWYEGTLQTVIFNQPKDGGKITQMITSLLAGYAWDQNNPFVKDGKRLLNMLADQCR